MPMRARLPVSTGIYEICRFSPFCNSVPQIGSCKLRHLRVGYCLLVNRPVPLTVSRHSSLSGIKELEAQDTVHRTAGLAKNKRVIGTPNQVFQAA